MTSLETGPIELSPRQRQGQRRSLGAVPAGTGAPAGDAVLVAAALGDRAGFAAIYDRYADRLYDFCVGMLREQEAAADCVQEVFCTAATRLGQLREPDKLRPWLYAIARRQALACIQARQREQPAEELPDETDGQPDLAVLAARTELTELVRHAAGGLSERDQTLLELHYHHGLDGPELATALGVSATNANTMLGRLRTTVDRSLGAYLLARRAHQGHSDCPELTRLVGGWDGHFTVLTRKRIARHLDSCASCHTERARVVNPRALLGAAPVLLPAPAWLREHTLTAAPTPPAFPPPLPPGPTPGPPPAAPPGSSASPGAPPDVQPGPSRPAARHRSPRREARGRRVPQSAKLAAAAGAGAAAVALAMTLAAPPSPATPTALAVPVAEHTLTRAVTLPPSVLTRPGHDSTVTVAAPPASPRTVALGAPQASTVTVTAAPAAGPTKTVHDPAPAPRTITRTVTTTVTVGPIPGGGDGSCKKKITGCATSSGR